LITDIEITCLPKDLPEYFEVDIKNLGLNEMLYIADIKLPEGVEIPILAQGPEENRPIVSIAFIKEVVIEEEVEEIEGELVEGEAPQRKAPTKPKAAKHPKNRHLRVYRNEAAATGGLFALTTYRRLHFPAVWRFRNHGHTNQHHCRTR
jgi:hypothetical protein